MLITKSAHQGDVYIKKCSLPENIEIKEFKDGKTVLAYGEITGHSHRFETDNVKLFVAKDGSGKTYIMILDIPAVLIHEEHDPIEFAPGAYEIFIAREWTDENEPRSVID